MRNTLTRGLLAGAAGTTALNAASYLDMALTGRAASSTPDEVAERLVDRAGWDLPMDDERRTAYGAASGIVTGLGIGVLAAAARRLGVRVPAPVSVLATGAAAMLASDGGAVVTGVTDLRTWTAADWARDVLPHLAFGLGVRATLDATEPAAPSEPTEAEAPKSASKRVGGALARAFVLGVATGGRSSLGLAGSAQAIGGAAAGLVGLGTVGAELTLDKLSATPSRLDPLGLVSRLVGGIAGGVAVARRTDVAWVAPVVAGVAGAAVGSVAGATWREVTAERDLEWQGAAAEDVAALAMAAWALR